MCVRVCVCACVRACVRVFIDAPEHVSVDQCFCNTVCLI